MMESCTDLQLWRESGIDDKGDFDVIIVLAGLFATQTIMRINQPAVWQLTCRTVMESAEGAGLIDNFKKITLDKDCWRVSSNGDTKHVDSEVVHELAGALRSAALNVSVGCRQVGDKLVPARIVYCHEGSVYHIALK